MLELYMHVEIHPVLCSCTYYMYNYSVGVLEEAKFFGISKAIDPLETLVRVCQYTYHSRSCAVM